MPGVGGMEDIKVAASRGQKRNRRGLLMADDVA
jgi:hypothetical protein